MVVRFKRRAKRRPIPNKKDWAGFEKDLDVQYFHRLAFGKSNEEIQPLFENGRSIVRSDELLFAPRAVFQYYVHGFAAYLMSAKGKGDSDAASSFLGLLKTREDRDSGSVKEIYAELATYVEFVASHQDYFEADQNIYGNFADRVNDIR